MKLKSILLLVLILALLLAGCATQPAATQVGVEPTAAATEAPTSAPAEPVELNVFAAASLTDAFSEIGKMFEANHPGVTAVFNFAGSQQLAQQINEGAPADVFASANKKQMDVVIEAGGIVSGTQQTFVKNRLVVIFPKDNPAGLTELKDLASTRPEAGPRRQGSSGRSILARLPGQGCCRYSVWCDLQRRCAQKCRLL